MDFQPISLRYLSIHICLSTSFSDIILTMKWLKYEGILTINLYRRMKIVTDKLFCVRIPRVWLMHWLLHKMFTFGKLMLRSQLGEHTYLLLVIFPFVEIICLCLLMNIIVILNMFSESASLIDFETCAMNYEAVDLANLFCTITGMRVLGEYLYHKTTFSFVRRCMVYVFYISLVRLCPGQETEIWIATRSDSNWWHTCICKNGMIHIFKPVLMWYRYAYLHGQIKT